MELKKPSVFSIQANFDDLADPYSRMIYNLSKDMIDFEGHFKDLDIKRLFEPEAVDYRGFLIKYQVFDFYNRLALYKPSPISYFTNALNPDKEEIDFLVNCICASREHLKCFDKLYREYLTSPFLYLLMVRNRYRQSSRDITETVPYGVIREPLSTYDKGGFNFTYSIEGISFWRTVFGGADNFAENKYRGACDIDGYNARIFRARHTQLHRF